MPTFSFSYVGSECVEGCGMLRMTRRICAHPFQHSQLSQHVFLCSVNISVWWKECTTLYTHIMWQVVFYLPRHMPYMVCADSEELKKAYMQLLNENGTSVIQTVAEIVRCGHCQRWKKICSIHSGADFPIVATTEFVRLHCRNDNSCRTVLTFNIMKLLQ